MFFYDTPSLGIEENFLSPPNGTHRAEALEAFPLGPGVRRTFSVYWPAQEARK